MSNPTAVRLGRIYIHLTMSSSAHSSVSIARCTIGYLLEQIEDNDTNYDVREILIWKLFLLCKEAGFECGIDIDPTQPEGDRWPIVRIFLPGAGQVSWHMPPCKIKYDDHTNEEKYERCRKYTEYNKPTPIPGRTTRLVVFGTSDTMNF